ncbi:MAG TPA: TatD family hydrolase [Anaerolineaceae bacterium]
MRLLTDTHCHLNLNIFQDDLAQVLERASARGIGRILIPGIDVATSRLAVALAEQHDWLYAAVGVHPGEASTWKDDTLTILKELARHPKVAAIGEIGLDYYRDRSPRPLQREIFQAQLALAAELGLPVVVHNRESLEDLWSDLSAWHDALVRGNAPLARRPGVLHSFDGSLSTATQAIERNFFIGISGPVTFKNATERQSVVTGLPLDHLLIETDAPYLTPHPYRGRWPNEPAFVAFVAEKIAALHQQPVETVTRITWENAAQLFDWGVNS